MDLVFSLEMMGKAARVPVEQEFSIGKTHYSLYAVLFASGTHFNATIKLGDNWYKYDDLGVSANKNLEKITIQQSISSWKQGEHSLP